MQEGTYSFLQENHFAAQDSVRLISVFYRFLRLPSRAVNILNILVRLNRINKSEILSRSEDGT